MRPGASRLGVESKRGKPFHQCGFLSKFATRSDVARSIRGIDHASSRQPSLWAGSRLPDVVTHNGDEAVTVPLGSANFGHCRKFRGSRGASLILLVETWRSSLVPLTASSARSNCDSTAALGGRVPTAGFGVRLRQNEEGRRIEAAPRSDAERLAMLSMCGTGSP